MLRLTIVAVLLFCASAAQSWAPRGPLPAAVSQHAIVPLCEGSGNFLLLIGGKGAANQDLADVRLYSIKDGTWATFPSLLKPRSSLAAARLGSVILICGGENQQPNGALGDETCESLDLSLPVSQRAWVSAPSLPQPRTSAGLAALPDGLGWILTGGFMTSGYTYFATTLYLPVNGSAWRDLGDAGKLPQGGRSNFGVAVAGGLVFMFGGSALNPSYVDCAVFNVSTMTWAATTPLPAPRAWMAVSTLSDNTILIIGGVDATFNFLSSVLQSNPVNGSYSLKWHDAPPLPFTRAFSGAGACRVEVFDIGGEGPEAGVNNSFYSL